MVTGTQNEAIICIFTILLLQPVSRVDMSSRNSLAAQSIVRSECI